MASPTYSAYSDGSACNTRRIGGWGFVIVDSDGRLVRSGYSERTLRDVSSNMMELCAAARALECALTLPPGPLRIHCDSVYVVNGASKWRRAWEERRWRAADGGEIANRVWWKGLFRHADALAARAPVSWKWVKGHNGDKWNECVDRLAHYSTEARVKADIVLAHG
jgi:ribonuclease HI